MAQEIAKGPFVTQLASDIRRDGLGLELLAGDKVVAEIFRCDADNSLIVTTFNYDIPLVEVERFIALARNRLDEFEDGSPLPVV